MNLFGTMDTSGGAMQAERMRAEVVAANMANAETTRTASGGAYRRQHVVFAANRPETGFLNAMNAAAGGGLDHRGAGLGCAADAGTAQLGRCGARGAHRAGARGPGAAAEALRPGTSRRRPGRVCVLSRH